MVNELASPFGVVLSNVPQKSVTGPILFRIFVDSTLTQLAGHTKFQGTANVMGDTKQSLLANWKDGPVLKKKLNLMGINLKFYI